MINLVTCSTCGYQWERGTDGSHWCPSYMQATIKRLEAEITALRARPEGVTISMEMLHFLHGICQLDGVWFGDKHPAHRGVFWWRMLLPDYGEPDALCKPQVHEQGGPK